MRLKIKNKSLLVSKRSMPSGTEIVIHRQNKTSFQGQTRLLDVFEFHPAGVLYKDETGIGATTLELKSSRNSIIVEPIKITASSKAKLENAFYVGSTTKAHPKKFNKKNLTNYLIEPSNIHKKIIVVADSLSKVIETIGQDVYENYFLLIDEIDSFQLDSTFRKSMESCLEFYKKFPAKNRAMVSATYIKFTDPELAIEPITYIRYDTPSIRSINVITTTSVMLISVVVKTILELLKKHPNDKLFIAYNSVGGCYNLASHLVKEGINTDDVCILCSTSSKDKVKPFYVELEEDKLPRKVNFATSAYFTGFDVQEKFHLISVSGTWTKYHSLSDRRLKQIAGRSRLGLISETIIHDIVNPKEKVINLTPVQLISDAKSELHSLECMKKHFTDSPLLSNVYEDISSKLIQAFDDKGVKYIKKDQDTNPAISYLNIDAFIESLRIRNSLYRDWKALTNKLKEDGHKVIRKLGKSEILVEDKKLGEIDRKEKTEQIFQALENVSDKDELIQISQQRQYNAYQKQIVADYIKLFDYLGPDVLVKMKKALLDKRDSREYNRLMSAATMIIYPKTYLVNQRLDYYFPIGAEFTPEQILKRMKLFFKEAMIRKDLPSEISAVKYLGIYRDLVRKKVGSKNGRKITGENPFGFNVKKYKPNLEDIT